MEKNKIDVTEPEKCIVVKGIQHLIEDAEKVANAATRVEMIGATQEAGKHINYLKEIQAKFL